MPDRYSRQALFPPLGAEGQARLAASCASVVGLGALGCASAALLARAGVGRLRLYDRDFVELENLQRQVLYDEADVSSDLPKAEAAARRLRLANSDVEVAAFVADVNFSNARSVVAGAGVVLDGTDNFETRLLINDACLEAGKPWVYAGCVGSGAMVMAVVPGRTPCLRCLLAEVPAAGAAPTCDTAGILNAAAVLAASVQAAEAVKLLAGKEAELMPGVFCADLWRSDFQVVRLAVRPGCPACGKRDYEYLAGRAGTRATSLCGRGAVQVLPASASEVDLEALARRLQAAGSVRRNDFLLRFASGGLEMTLFKDGRAIVKGTGEEAAARAFYARFVGA